MKLTVKVDKKIQGFYDFGKKKIIPIAKIDDMLLLTDYLKTYGLKEQ